MKWGERGERTEKTEDREGEHGNGDSVRSGAGEVDRLGAGKSDVPVGAEGGSRGFARLFGKPSALVIIVIERSYGTISRRGHEALYCCQRCQ